MEPVLTDEEVEMLLKKMKEENPKLSFHLKMLVHKIKSWFRYGNSKIRID